MLYLVRHAKAGSRREWSDDDRLRPLSKTGMRQADALAKSLAKLANGDLVSSPYLRCVQTLEPLAARLGVGVRADERLAEDARFEGALSLLGELPDGSALCSHGDVIPAAIDALQRRGCEIVGTPDWRKATVWVLSKNDEGLIVAASAWPPPDV